MRECRIEISTTYGNDELDVATLFRKIREVVEGYDDFKFDFDASDTEVNSDVYVTMCPNCESVISPVIKKIEMGGMR